jgi:hypothetical protein
VDCNRDRSNRTKRQGYYSTKQWKEYQHVYRQGYSKTTHGKGILAARTRRRYASKLLRTPKWADLNKIKTVYIEAARLTEETGINMHVDHIIPLQGRKVSGLHVFENLRIIPAKENISKNNRFQV